MGVKPCVVCSRSFRATGNSKRCPPCRTASGHSVLAAVRAQLDSVGQTQSSLGQAAMVLAARLDTGTDPGSAMAAMAKELRSTMDELTRSSPAVGDPVDELRRRREARKRGA